VYLYPAFSAGGLLSPETLSSHTFPYDLLRICPALGPRPRRTRSLNARPRSLPLTIKRKPPAMKKISGLNHAAFALAVYASQILSPRPMQNSLPVTCSVLLGEMHGSIPWFSQGHLERFLLFPPSTSFRVANCSLLSKDSAHTDGLRLRPPDVHFIEGIPPLFNWLGLTSLVKSENKVACQWEVIPYGLPITNWVIKFILF